MKYQTTKAHCQKMIRGICSQCGGKLVPIKTVDNSRQPTYWSGCERCCRFDWGCDPEIYEIAKRLVDSHYYVPYTHMDQPKDNATKAAKDYYRETQIGGATDTVSKVLRIQKELRGD